MTLQEGGRVKGAESSPAPPVADQYAERAVLGSLLIYGQPRYVVALVGRGLRAEHFYWSRYAAVFRAVVSLAERQSAIDPIIVSAEMERHGEPWSRGEIDSLSGDVPAAGNLTDYADRVRSLANWRERTHIARLMVDAARERNEETWKLASVRLRSPATEPEPMVQPRLRLVVDGETGTVLEKQHHCPGCAELEDQVKGTEKEIRAWRSRYADLKRDKEADARDNALWLVAQALFEAWKRATKHPRSEFTTDRFYVAEPLLRRYGPRVFERAIAGIAFDPYETLRRNGTKQRHDGWDLLCKSAGKFEEFANRAPSGWQPVLKVSLPSEQTQLLEDAG